MEQNGQQQKIIIGLMVALLIVAGVAFLYFKKAKNLENLQTPVATIPTTPSTPSTGSGPSATPITAVGGTPPKAVAPPPPPLPAGTDQFVVSLSATTDEISANLLTGGYITDSAKFSASIGTTKPIAPGAYKIAKVMTPTQLLQVLRGKPYMKWVVIPPGLRKEEIADLLAPALGWTAKQKTEWITKDTIANPDYIEGVYAPDTYLIPVGETPVEVTARIIAKFNEGFAYYLPQFTAKNIKWTTALTLASLVQREAANVADMPLIAGILWNRLNQNIALDVDATVQYIRGNKGAGWWAPITVADKQIDSPYNTYEHTGLPPHPIAEPSLDAIAAVLNPALTQCIYYLHDKNHITHCAVTYEEHQQNIQTYLVNGAN